MPGAESTAYLLRHAKAGSRERWTSPDRERPLSHAGTVQAAALFAVLGPGIRSIRSSPYVRCMQTVEPLASALGLPVVSEPRLAEGEDPEWTARQLALGGGALFCTHGDVMAAVVCGLSEASVPLVGGMQWAKGSTWVFEVGGGRIVAGRYVPPPG